MVDYSNLSDEDLKNVYQNNYKNISNEGLKELYNDNQTTLQGGIEKNIDLTPSGLIHGISENVSAGIMSPITALKNNASLPEAFNQTKQEMRELRNLSPLSSIADNITDFGAYAALPQIKLLKGAGALSKIGNMTFSNAYQGGLIEGIESMKKKGISNDTLKDIKSGAKLGAMIPIGFHAFGKLGGWTKKPVSWAAKGFAKNFARLKPETLQQAIKVDSKALDMTPDEAENLLLNTSERVRKSYEQILNNRGEAVANAAKNLRKVEDRIPIANLKDDILTTFNQYQGDLVNPARNMTDNLENQLYELLNSATPESALKNLLKQVDNADYTHNKVELTNVSNKLKQIAEKYGVNLDEYTHNIDTSAIKHIKNKHGNFNKETTRGQIPVNNDDFLNIPDIVQNPDNIDFIGKNHIGRDLIKYTKQMPDNLTNYIEEIRNGKKTLSGQTMYKNGGRTAANAASSTSETISTNNIIPYNDQFFNSVSPIDLQKAKEQIGKMVNWSDEASRNYKNPILEQIYGKYTKRLSELSPELSKANQEYATLRDFQKNEGLKKILKPGDNLDSASSALKNYNSTITSGNKERNIKDLEKLLVENGYEPFLNTIDDINAVQDLNYIRTTGDSWKANIGTVLTKPVLHVLRGANRAEIPKLYKSLGKEIPSSLAPIIVGTKAKIQYKKEKK